MVLVLAIEFTVCGLKKEKKKEVDKRIGIKGSILDYNVLLLYDDESYLIKHHCINKGPVKCHINNAILFKRIIIHVSTIWLH